MAIMSIETKEFDIDGIKFSIPNLGKYGFSLGIKKYNKTYDKKHFIVSSVNSIFIPSRFSQQHLPIIVDEISDKDNYSKQSDICVLDMPIKFPGSLEYRVPNELRQFREALEKIGSFEHSINQNIKDAYAYLTVDQGDISANIFQRNPGCHSDGIQGTKVIPKTLINRSYYIYDCIPTVFYSQQFRTDHLYLSYDNFFHSFDRQAKEEAECRYDCYNILALNAYTIHRSDKISIPTYRTFLRLTYDVRMYDRFGNTHNPMFDYEWKMEYKSIRHLAKNNFEIEQ